MLPDIKTTLNHWLPRVVDKRNCTNVFVPDKKKINLQIYKDLIYKDFTDRYFSTFRVQIREQ